MYNNNYSNYLNNSYNPYSFGNVSGINSPYQTQRQEVTKVNGMDGANAYPLTANSSVLLLDINNPIVYLKQSDGGGFCNVVPYSITPIEQNKSITINTDDLEKRISRLEDIINESYSISIEDIKQSKSNQSNTKH